MIAVRRSSLTPKEFRSAKRYGHGPEGTAVQLPRAESVNFTCPAASIDAFVRQRTNAIDANVHKHDLGSS